MKFSRWLSQSFEWARGVRLPTEEEWEYACRAGTETKYWSGNEESDLDRVGWFKKNSGESPHAVGEKPANAWGLYDVHGNVWEWTLSPYVDSYSGREQGHKVDPAEASADLAAPGSGRRVTRGGCCRNVVGNARAAIRYDWTPDSEIPDHGFRLLLPPRPAEPDLRS